MPHSVRAVITEFAASIGDFCYTTLLLELAIQLSMAQNLAASQDAEETPLDKYDAVMQSLTSAYPRIPQGSCFHVVLDKMRDAINDLATQAMSQSIDDVRRTSTSVQTLLGAENVKYIHDNAEDQVADTQNQAMLLERSAADDCNELYKQYKLLSDHRLLAKDFEPRQYNISGQLLAEYVGVRKDVTKQLDKVKLVVATNTALQSLFRKLRTNETRCDLVHRTIKVLCARDLKQSLGAVLSLMLEQASKQQQQES